MNTNQRYELENTYQKLLLKIQLLGENPSPERDKLIQELKQVGSELHQIHLSKIQTKEIPSEKTR